jgi:hypothetical protein
VQSFQVAIHFNYTQALEGRLKATHNVFQDGVVPLSLSHPSLVHCVGTMNENMEKRLFHSVPTEMAVDRGTFPPPFKVNEGGQYVNAGIQSELQNTMRKIPHLGLPINALTLTLQESKEVSLHSIAADASSPCIILFLTKNSSDLFPDGQHFWDRVSLCWNGLDLRRLLAWFHNWV